MSTSTCYKKNNAKQSMEKKIKNVSFSHFCIFRPDRRILKNCIGLNRNAK